MIQERAAVGRVKEFVAQRVLLRELAFRQVCRVDVAEDEARVVAPGDELVEVAVLRFQKAVIDLQLLVIETVHDVTSESIGSNVSCEVVGYQRQRPGCDSRPGSTSRPRQGTAGRSPGDPVSGDGVW